VFNFIALIVFLMCCWFLWMFICCRN